MRILYVSSDPGINIDDECGAGTHIQETIRALEQLGHSVYVAAPEFPGTLEDKDSKFLIKRHRWFDRFKRVRASQNRFLPSSNFACKITKKNGEGVDHHTVSNIQARGNCNLKSWLKEKIIKFYYGQFQRSLNLLEEMLAYHKRFFREVKQIIKKYRPDAVYERYALGQHYIANYCHKNDIPHILEVNALLANEAVYARSMNRIIGKYFISREMQFLQNTGTIFVVSRYLKDLLDQGKSEIFFHPNGVDPDFFNPARTDPARIKQRYNLQGFKILGWIGGFRPLRGAEEVLEIGHHCIKIDNSIRILLVGDGPLKSKLEELVSCYSISDYVIFTGRLPKTEMPDLISAMDICLAPYPEDGARYFSPLKVFEYMAMAKPIVATDEGQCKELLCGGAGLLLPFNDKRKWAREILALLDNDILLRNMGTKARQRILSEFTWKKNAKRIEKKFNEMIESSIA